MSDEDRVSLQSLLFAAPTSRGALLSWGCTQLCTVRSRT